MTNHPSNGELPTRNERRAAARDEQRRLLFGPSPEAYELEAATAGARGCLHLSYALMRRAREKRAWRYAQIMKRQSATESP